MTKGKICDDRERDRGVEDIVTATQFGCRLISQVASAFR